MEFGCGYGLWNTWTASGITSRRRNVDSDGTDGNSHSTSTSFWSEIGRTPGCPACETPGPGKSHTRECKTYQDAWEGSRRTASPEEAKRGIVGDPDGRPLDLSGSSLDPEPKRTKTTSVTDNENSANRMDEDNFQRGPATSHQLEPVDDENVWQETFFTSVVRTV